MRPWILLLVYGGMCACLGACAPVIAAPGTPEAFTFACDKSNEGQLISMEGYLRLPPSLNSTRTVTLDLYPDPSFKGTPIGVVMQFGDGPNEAHKISSSYHDSDLTVHLADGTPVPFGTRVRVSGWMQIPLEHEDYACILQDPYVEPAN